MDYKSILQPWHNESTISDEELFLLIRLWRNSQLALTDYTQLSDSPVNKNAWAEYRQQLRDLPEQNADPKLIVFPEPPQNN